GAAGQQEWGQGERGGQPAGRKGGARARRGRMGAGPRRGWAGVAEIPHERYCAREGWVRPGGGSGVGEAALTRAPPLAGEDYDDGQGLIGAAVCVFATQECRIARSATRDCPWCTILESRWLHC